MAKKLLGNDYVAEFCREISASVHSGLPVSDGIYMLMEDDNSAGDEALLKKMYEITESGEPFATAIKACGCFPGYVEEMVEIGEKTGRLDEVLSQLSGYYARQNQISRSIKNAILFPSVLLTILVIIVAVLLTQIMPIFNDVFVELGVSMSPVAEFLYSAGGIISAVAVGALVLAALGALVIMILRRNARSKDKLTGFFRNGKISRELASSRFASAMALTLSSGMDIDESLEMSKKLCDKFVGEKIDRCSELMKSGKPFDKAIKEVGIFNAINCRRLVVSFRTGKTDEAMEQIAIDSEERFNSAIDEKISKVEPTLVALMSVIVGVILFSVMLPMMSIITSV